MKFQQFVWTFFRGGMGGGEGGGFRVGWGGIDCVLTEIRKRGKLSGNMHYYKKCPRQPRFLFSFFFSPRSFCFLKRLLEIFIFWTRGHFHPPPPELCKIHRAGKKTLNEKGKPCQLSKRNTPPPLLPLPSPAALYYTVYLSTPL